jgi:hypothetical protein
MRGWSITSQITRVAIERDFGVLSCVAKLEEIILEVWESRFWLMSIP